MRRESRSFTSSAAVARQSGRRVAERAVGGSPAGSPGDRRSTGSGSKPPGPKHRGCRCDLEAPRPCLAPSPISHLWFDSLPHMRSLPMAEPSRAERALRGRIGAYRLHATHDSRETSRAGRLAFLASFERAVDPDGVLSEAERARRAAHARSAHFARLAYLSARARRRRALRRSGPRGA